MNYKSYFFLKNLCFCVIVHRFLGIRQVFSSIHNVFALIQHWHCLSTPNAAHEASRRSQMLQIQKTFSPSTNTVKHQWMVTLSRMHFAAEWRTCQTSLNERMMFVQPIFHNVWLKSGSRNTFKSQFLFLIREKQVVFHEMVPLCMKQMMNSHNSHIQKKTALKPAKNYANWSNCCTDISNWI